MIHTQRRVLDFAQASALDAVTVKLLTPFLCISTFAAALAFGADTSTSAKPNLRDQFQSPPADKRILQIIHNFPTGKALDARLNGLSTNGFGGIVCNVNFKDYLRSETNWADFATGVRAALDRGMALWLYDEQGYPSGAAGGLTMEGHPDWQAMGLLCVSTNTAGEAISVDLPKGNVIAARACPVDQNVINLEKSVDLAKQISGQKLVWTPPAGNWRTFVFVQSYLHEGTHAAGNVFADRPYVNLLMREPTARFIELTHAEYARRFPELFGHFEAMFTDEPSLMTVFLKTQPYPPLPWMPTMAKEFRRNSGYDLLPYLPALMTDAGADTVKVRCDFWNVVGKLVSENYFGQIQDWCRKHHIASSGHLLSEENLCSHVGFYGSFYACARRLDWPSIDCLTSKPEAVPWYIAKLLSSIGHLHGGLKTMSETSDHVQRYRRPDDKRSIVEVTEDDIRGTCNRLYVGGVNTTTSYYQWRTLSPDQQRQFNAYTGRLGVMLTGGKHVCDVAVFYPIESVWAHYVPATHGATTSPQALAVQHTYTTVSRRLFENRRDFDYIDSDELRRGSVKRGKLSIGPESYRVIVLPRVDTLPLDVWRKMADFYRGGGIIVAVGATPSNSLRKANDPEITRITREIFGDTTTDSVTSRKPNRRGGIGLTLNESDDWILPMVLDSLIEADFKSVEKKSPLRYAHHSRPEGDIYFVINDSATTVEEAVSFRAEGEAAQWNPETGNVSKLSSQTLRLKPYSSTFVVFPHAREAKRVSGAALEMPALNCISLESAVKQPVKFEAHPPSHVKATATANPFSVKAQIKTGGVDSHCFSEAKFEKPIDLSAFAGLNITTSVPDTQSGCGTKLLIILHEEGGADYLADSGRILSDAGSKTSHVWFDAFHLAGWSKDSNHQLDLNRITAIRIGWGGYFGKTDEIIEFSLRDIGLLSVGTK